MDNVAQVVYVRARAGWQAVPGADLTVQKAPETRLALAAYRSVRPVNAL